MNKILIFLATFFLMLNLNAQQQALYKLIKSFPVNGKTIAADEFKNSYVVNDENNVIKLDSIGKLRAIYSENKYGKVSSLDATNPFTILSFYKDFNTAMTLDINMSAKRLYKFSAAGIKNAAAACMSYDNGIWVFDNADQKLKKINQNYETVTESPAINQMIDLNINPNFMIEREQMIFVNDPKLGIFVFDIFGSYFRSFQITGLNNFQVINKQLVCYKDSKLYTFDIRSSKENTIALPKVTAKIKEINVTRNYLVLLTTQDLQVYKVVMN